MLLETDAYPQMFKKNRAKWTEPKDIAIVAEKLAALRGTTAEEIQEITTNNALKMLGKRARMELTFQVAMIIGFYVSNNGNKRPVEDSI